MTYTQPRETVIPAFVIRGLATLDDPSDLSSVRYSTEAHLRDALAAIWWMKGLVVRTEVDVPACGRIDVMGRIGDERLVVELKKKIETPSEARKAFAQAHMYQAFLQSQDVGFSIQTQAFVTAGSLSWEASVAAQSAYVTVDHLDFVTTSNEPENNYRLQRYRDAMLAVSRSRLELLRDLSAATRTGERAVSMAIEAYQLDEAAS